MSNGNKQGKRENRIGNNEEKTTREREREREEEKMIEDDEMVTRKD